MNRKIRTLLVFPPNFAVDQPYLSIPQLIAFLRKKGIKQVKQFDANIDSFYYFTRKTFLKRCIVRIKAEREQIEKSWRQSSTTNREKYPYLCETLLYFPGVMENIRKSIDYFKNFETSNTQEYNFRKNVINRAFDIIAAAYYPTQVSIRNFSMRFSNQSFSEIFKAVNSKENPYVDYFKNVLLGKIEKGKYSLIGLSITALSQIIPSFTLAYLVKKHFPNINVVFGGQVFNRLEKNVKQISDFFTYVDFLIVNEGETALLQLIRYLEGKNPIAAVPNLLYYCGKEKEAKRTNQVRRENMLDLPAPNYDALDLSKYLASKPVLSYQPARGCYWCKCKFCNQFLIYGEGMRCREIETIISDLRYLKNRYKTTCFTLVNESVAPGILSNIAQGLIHKSLQIKWYAGARFDGGFDHRTLELLKKSGCEKLYFGLESGSQKVLDKMNKGINLKTVTRILRDCWELRIGVHLFIMIGFPTETKEDLESSNTFVFETLKHVDKDSFSFYISIYQLKPETYVFDNPNEFNIRNIFRNDSYDLEYLYKFDRISRPPDINYEHEKRDMEETIDRIAGTRKFPENIVHYLNFKENFRDKGEIISKTSVKACHESENPVFCFNPDLTFGCFKYYPSQSSQNSSGRKSSHSYLIYEIRNDNLFEIPNKYLWKMLKTVNQCFTIDELEKLLQKEFDVGANDMNLVRNFTKQLIDSQIFINVNGGT